MSQKIDFTTLNGYTIVPNLTGQTYAGNYAVSDLSGWTITIPSSVFS